MIVAAIVLLTASLLKKAPRSTTSISTNAPTSASDAGDPFDLSTALGFGLLLGVLALLTRAAQQWMGDAGLYALSLLSGLLDVDAILLTVMHMNGQGTLPIDQATIAAGLAVIANMLMKAMISWCIGGTSLGWRVTVGFCIAMAAAAIAALLLALR